MRRRALVALVAGVLTFLFWGSIAGMISEDNTQVSGAEAKTVSKVVAPEATAAAEGVIIWVAGGLVTVALAVARFLGRL